MGQAGNPKIDDLLRRSVALHTDEMEEYDLFLKLSKEISALDVDVLRPVESLLITGNPSERSAMVDLIARYSFEKPGAIRDACFQLLSKNLEVESTSSVIADNLTALGHLHDKRSLPIYLRFTDHVDENVRFSVAQALPIGTNFDSDSRAISALVQLSSDVDSDVRDWACFGLGQLEADGDNVRDALAARLDDKDDDTRAEALSALAGLADKRVVPRLLELLAQQDVWMLTVESAAKVASPELHPLLLKIRQRATEEKNWKELDFALRRCDPRALELAKQWEQIMFPLLVASVAQEGHTIERIGDYPLTSFKVMHGDREIFADRIWDYNDPIESPSPEVEAESWTLTIRNSIEEN